MTLHIDHIALERNDQLLFHSICQTLSAGESLQVCGANGSGKSTLLRILVGLIEPSYGTVTWQGKSIFSDAEPYREKLHYIGHQHGLRLHLTIQENWELQAVLRKSKKNKNTEMIADKMHLADIVHKKAIHLSAGQLRRAALARLLLQPKMIWIVDEPTTSLDKAGQELFFSLADEHVKNGGILILSTHHDVTYEKIISL